MAAGILLVPGWTPAVDSDGAPIPNARAYYYLEETTTLAPIFSDEGLTTPLTNPVEANSSGRWPIIWAGDANTYTWSIEAPYGPPGLPFTGTGLMASQATDLIILEGVNAAADQADDAATAATDAYNDILALAASLPDTDPIVIAGKANVSGSNILGANQAAFRNQINAQNATFTQIGASAVARPLIDKIEEVPITPMDFGAVGDGVADDTLAVQRSLTAAATQKRPWSLDAIVCMTTDTVTADSPDPLRPTEVDFGSGSIVYTGPTDRPIFVYGNANTLMEGAIVHNVDVSGPVNWTSDNYVGCRLYNIQRSSVSVRNTRGPAVGVQPYARVGGWAHNHVEFGELCAHRWYLDTVVDGSAGGTVYLNENTFYGGNLTTRSLGNLLGGNVGWNARVINGGFVGNDNNTWFRPCFQNGTGQIGDLRVPVYFRGGFSRCRIFGARSETARGGASVIAPFAILEDYSGAAPCIGNEFNIQLLDTTYVSATIQQVGLSRYNTVTSDDWTSRTNNQTVSLDALQQVYCNNNVNASVSGSAHFNLSGLPVQVMAGVTTRLNSIVLGSGGLGFYIDTSGGETFMVTQQTELDSNGAMIDGCRFFICAFDANGARLTNISTPTAVQMGIVGTPGTYTGGVMGGGWQFSVDLPSIVFQVGTQVRRVEVMAYSGRLQGLSVTRTSVVPDMLPLVAKSGLNRDDAARYTSTGDLNAGNIGIYQRGQIFLPMNANLNQPIAYQCTADGRLASTRVPSAVVTVGDVFLADTNKIYRVVTAGTLSGGAGPTGTGTGIADGTAVVDYLCPKAVFVQCARNPGAAGLLDADATLTIGGGQKYRLSINLTAARTITLSNTGAVAGDELVITRSDAGAFNLNVNNAAASLLKAMPAASGAEFVYNGSAWYLSQYGTL